MKKKKEWSESNGALGRREKRMGTRSYFGQVFDCDTGSREGRCLASHLEKVTCGASRGEDDEKRLLTGGLVKSVPVRRHGGSRSFYGRRA